MLVRIVKMNFKFDKIEEFLVIFNKNKEIIRSSKGCNFLELYRDKSNANIFFTYSHWETETDLENYRKSDLFKKVWGNTKVLFEAKPKAWSTDKLWGR